MGLSYFFILLCVLEVLECGTNWLKYSSASAVNPRLVRSETWLHLSYDLSVFRNITSGHQPCG